MQQLILALSLLLGGVTGAAHAAETQQDAIRTLLHSFAAQEGDADRLLALRAAVNDAILETALNGIDAERLPMLGQGDGTVIYEFSDYQCGFCRRMFPAVMDAANSGKVRVALIELPILGALSDEAARIALAAHAQGKFPAYHQALMRTSGRLSEHRIDAAIDAAQLDRAQMEAYLDSKEAEAQLESNFKLAALLDVHGTPAFVVNGHIYRGALEEEAFHLLWMHE